MVMASSRQCYRTIISIPYHNSINHMNEQAGLRLAYSLCYHVLVSCSCIGIVYTQSLKPNGSFRLYINDMITKHFAMKFVHITLNRTLKFMYLILFYINSPFVKFHDIFGFYTVHWQRCLLVNITLLEC